jgi:PAS domain S-box-containing protein
MSRILIVDDNEQNRYMLETLLKGNGYEVMTAANGRLALESAGEDRPHLIISDILMPVMDGFELCRKLKKDPLLEMIPLVFYTATYTEPKDEHFALKLGAVRFVIKPQDPEILLKMVEEVLTEHLETPDVVIAESPIAESVVFEEYSEVLFRKLEKKVRQLEAEILSRGKVEQALRLSELRYRQMFETAYDALLLVDSETGEILDVNPRATELLALTRGELIRHMVWDIKPLKKLIPSKMVLVGYQSVRKVVLNKIQLSRKEGTTFPVEILTCLYQVNDKNVLQINIRDLSGLKPDS